MKRIIIALAAALLALSAIAADTTEDAQFAIAAADFVTEHCTGLDVDYQKLGLVLGGAHLTEENAREGALYKRLITSYWPDTVKSIGMAEACYGLQAHFVKDAKGDMHRMILPR